MNTVNPADRRPYDALIVGSGAGGSAAAYKLASAGLRVALVEKGNELPRDASTLDFKQVVGEGRFKSQEVWLDNRGLRQDQMVWRSAAALRPTRIRDRRRAPMYRLANRLRRARALLRRSRADARRAYVRM